MDIGKGLQKSFDLYRQNFIVLLLATIAAAFVSTVTFGIIAESLTGGLILLCLKLMRGEKAGVHEVFSHFD